MQKIRKGTRNTLGEQRVEWRRCQNGTLIIGLFSYSSLSNKKHKNNKKKTSPKTDKRLTTMTEEEETLSRNDESKLGLVGQT